MEKLIRNGKVAVLISGDFGAGWSTWNHEHSQELLFNPKIVELVEQNKKHEITENLCKKLFKTDDYICVLGVNGLKIEWLPIGTAFSVEEYDGLETLRTTNDLCNIA